MGGRQRRSGEKSSFNVACGLLSQYIKERSSVADLGGGWHRHLRMRRKASRPRTTKIFLPGAGVAVGERKEKRVGEEEPRESVMELFSQRAGFGHSVAASAAEGNACCASDIRFAL
ncbi:lung seven transmembrane domain containing protein [Musa troglodytarum]|uniref:Lung seven transmembrane domain containing protein n=1 Tax=Musa troglodytarum TaxID=320322 RepID=A0A9E7K9A5_9LILI|nr:lung seven transmembrane domain containing protein [Musa troglodytarum]